MNERKDMNPTNQNGAVKRYDMKERVRGMESWYVLEQDPDGDYVSYEDYSALHSRLTSLEGALRELVNLYVQNKGTEYEFISCITPPSLRGMTATQRITDKAWSAWDKARALLSEAP